MPCLCCFLSESWGSHLHGAGEHHSWLLPEGQEREGIGQEPGGAWTGRVSVLALEWPCAEVWGEEGQGRHRPHLLHLRLSLVSMSPQWNTEHTLASRKHLEVVGTVSQPWPVCTSSLPRAVHSGPSARAVSPDGFLCLLSPLLAQFLCPVCSVCLFSVCLCLFLLVSFYSAPTLSVDELSPL